MTVSLKSTANGCLDTSSTFATIHSSTSSKIVASVPVGLRVSGLHASPQLASWYLPPGERALDLMRVDEPVEYEAEQGPGIEDFEEEMWQCLQEIARYAVRTAPHFD